MFMGTLSHGLSIPYCVLRIPYSAGEMSYWCPEVALKSSYRIGPDLRIKESTRCSRREAPNLNKLKKE